ncbi:MAG TPA: hypothetical protein PLY00_08060 [Verrucomicrobiota bacterium]|nr:hypothetical protein [Verrucomicrobiota bacterium]HOR71226.1 hypothetical protein [Verrucomicrobiota bacterium]HOU87226.1 hypothetical protein [Verrucomicrobiota bacterium]HPK97331.1 hypothetical protein [Verrucomicrobiota bacterium]HQF58948.1 hypothetical protein [Verrucomicrobiota bacterium]
MNNNRHPVKGDFAAKFKVLPTDSVFEAMRQHDVGMFGIKPFACNSLK